MSDTAYPVGRGPMAAYGRRPISGRAGLLRCTALTAVLLAGATVSTPVAAQTLPPALAARAATLSATALPTGGQVATGQASIAQSGTTLNVTQGSNTASINWRSFDVGTAGTVNFTAPSPQSLTVNRVTGPDPSVIAGKINANDRLILINQSGVVFTGNAQVNAQSLIASAAGITDANVKAGKLVLDQPARPNAAIINQGTLTVAQTGLAALVAPRVANSGVIRAKFGHVVLAGAQTAAVDLYGDGLLSLDVSNQVTTAPTGPDGKNVTSLVTNTGTITAQGGTIQLTAAAAEGIVTNLITVGGRIRANTAATPNGPQGGKVAIRADGGGVAVTGTVAAQGRKPGTQGGKIEVTATDRVTLANGAVVTASGKGGGGTIALGTTLARATGGNAVTAQAAKSVSVASGAVVAANATSSGNGGTIALLSSQSTAMAGTITAKGGPLGGHGGFVEVSGKTGFSLTGAVDVAANKGASGSILIDPETLTIAPNLAAFPPAATFINAGTDGSVNDSNAGAASIAPATFTSLTGNVTLAATSQINVSTMIDSTSLTSLLLTASTVSLGANTINLSRPGSTVSVQAGSLMAINGASISASTIEIAPLVNMPMVYGGGPTPQSSPKLYVPDSLTLGLSSSVLRLGQAAGRASATSVDVNAVLSATTLDLQSSGPVGQSAAGVIAASLLTGSANGFMSLEGANQIGTLSAVSALGTLSLTNTMPLMVKNTVSASAGVTLSLRSNSLTMDDGTTAGVIATGTGGVVITSGAITLARSGDAIRAPGQTVSLSAVGPINEGGNGVITAGTLTGSSTGTAILDGANAVATMGIFPTSALTLMNDAAGSIASTILLTTSTNAAPLASSNPGSADAYRSNACTVGTVTCTQAVVATLPAMVAMRTAVSLSADAGQPSIPSAPSFPMFAPSSPPPTTGSAMPPPPPASGGPADPSAMAPPASEPDSSAPAPARSPPAQANRRLQTNPLPSFALDDGRRQSSDNDISLPDISSNDY